MSLTKLRCLASAFGLTNKNVLVSRLSMRQTPAGLSCKREKATATKDRSDDDDLDKPIQFSGSPAAKWNAVSSRTGALSGEDDRPWFQTYVVLASTGAFLIYFCVLREENDVDLKLTRELSDHFPPEQREALKRSQELSVELSRAALARIAAERAAKAERAANAK